MVDSEQESNNLDGVAVIGMAGRFPGAASVDALWNVLTGGIDTIAHFAEEELEHTAATPEAVARGQRFVRARGVLADVDLFDAAFFGIYPREAEVMDPQHRLFLECAWEAIESAGYDPEAYPGLIGVFASLSMNTYLLHNLCADRAFTRSFAGDYQVSQYYTMVGNDKDFLPTRVSYKLGLRGPSMAVQCACSSSLVAICQASTSLLTYQSDMALAGGVSITFPQKRDYLYQEEAMVSADGTCRAFDAKAHGTIFGHGVATVLLKRLADAIADRDHILGVIKGTALNNDGAAKIGYAAPSVDAQAEVIAMAQAAAAVHPESVSYIEAHGTGTPMGDPIEVAALSEAFRRGGSSRTGYCAIGTAKPNVGHLDAAAGATGLIKVLLQLEHGLIPPLIHFDTPNPKIDFANSPFFPVTEPQEWRRGALPRIAGVSAFGVGGTNAHVVVAEPPALAAPDEHGRPRLLLLSARTPNALAAMTTRLADHLEANPNLGLADVAFTLQRGRRTFPHRRAVVAGALPDAIAHLRTLPADSACTAHATSGTPAVAFLFPGQGAQYAGMGAELYRSEPVFRENVDACAGIVERHLGLDIRTLLHPQEADRDRAQKELTQTSLTQPALFAVEYALARLWMSWGIQPAALVGHSLGEYVAAVLAGVMSLEDGLALLSTRARLMQGMPSGGMLSVRLPEDELRPLLSGSLAVAVVNSPKLTVVSGPHDELDALQARLEQRPVACKTLWTSHAFHSSMMEPVIGPFAEAVAAIQLSPASLPIVSTLTGKWIDPEDWMNPTYWTDQLRHTVRFADAAATLLARSDLAIVEVGPGQTLASLVRQRPECTRERVVTASMPPVGEPGEESAFALAVGRLWAAGAGIDWSASSADDRAHRVPLPTYPFERKRFWIAPPEADTLEDRPAPPVRTPVVPAGDTRKTNDATSTVSAQPAGVLDQVITRQLEIMREQLRSLGGG